MVDDEPLRPGLVPLADGDADDAEWLVGLIRAVRVQIEGAGLPEVADILDEALSAAQAAAIKARPKRVPH